MIEVGIRQDLGIAVGVIHQPPISVAALGSVRYYEGDYSVTPSAENRILSTKGLYMVKNITVAPIPYRETPNSAGGITVSIG